MVDNATPKDPELGWVPRFSNEGLWWIGIAFLVAWAVSFGFLREVFSDAKLFTDTDKDDHVIQLALLGFGLLGVLGGMFFALVEARRPPTPAEVEAARAAGDGTAPARGLDAVPVDPGKVIAAVAESLDGRKRSTAFLSVGVFFIVLSAASSGLINIELGSSDSPTSSSSTSSSSSVP